MLQSGRAPTDDGRPRAAGHRIADGAGIGEREQVTKVYHERHVPPIGAAPVKFACTGISGSNTKHEHRRITEKGAFAALRHSSVIAGVRFRRTHL